MVDEEKKAIEYMNTIVNDCENRWKELGYICNLYDGDEPIPVNVYKTILNLIKNQQAEINELQKTLVTHTVRTVCSDIKQSEKHKEDLEMLYKGCQLENEELKETMYKMASFIASQDIECDICEKTGNLDTCDSMAYGECENCIINYFKNSGK